MFKKFKNFLLTWKPIHLCWWYMKRGKPIPKYFIGGSASPPSVTTNAATSVSYYTATLNGDVTSDGGASITERGFVYSTTDTTPTIGEGGVTKQIVSGTTGTFSYNATGLTDNTTYYYQAYAINSKGTSYGGVQNFTTLDQVSPTVALNSPSDNAVNSSTTPALQFTGTDSNSDDIRYNIQVDTADAFNSGVGTVDSYSESNQNASYDLGAGTTPSNNIARIGQSFTGNGSAITSVKFYLKKVGSPTATLTAYLYAHSGTFGTSSVSTGSVLATSTTYSASSLTTSFQLIEFTFNTPYTTANGTNYCIEIGTTTIDSSNYVQVGTDDTSPSHAGNAYYNQGGVNTAQSGVDLIFDAIGGGAIIDAVSGTDAGFSGSPDNTDPFTSGQQVTYTVQSALASGTTHYWRVRGIDPTGGNTYGSWATTRNFTTQIEINTSDTVTIYDDVILHEPSANEQLDQEFRYIEIGYDFSNTTGIAGDGSSLDNEQASMSFTPSSTGKISSFKFRLKTGSGTPTDNLNLSIYSDSSGPDTLLGTADNSIASSSISSNSEFHTFTFSNGPTLSSGTKYHAVISRSGLQDDENLNAVVYKASIGTDLYTGGGSWLKQLGSWSDLENFSGTYYDFQFQYWYTPTSSGLSIDVNDSITITESVSSLINQLYVSASDSITITDTPDTVEIFIPTRFATASDDIALSEDVTIRLASYINVYDDTTITEDITIYITSFIDASDSITLTESVSISLKNYIDSSDSITITESVSVDIFDPNRLAVSFESLNLTESVSVLINELFAEASDSITLTESISVVINQLYVSASDSVTISDINSVILSISSSANDTITITESVSVTTSRAIDTSDDLTISEFIDIVRNNARDVSVYDDVILSESETVDSLAHPQVDTADDITITENVALSTKSFVDTADDITITENVNVVVTPLYLAVSDNISTSESVDVSIVSYISTNDTITITEDVNISLASYIDVNDTITITESVAVQVYSYIDTSDTITITEDVSVLTSSLAKQISTSDSIAIEDYSNLVLINNATTSDDISISENTIVLVKSYLSVSDDITLTESTTVYIATYIDTSDAIEITELTSITSSSYLDFSESITVEDFAEIIIGQGISANDSITLTESVSVTTGLNINVYDEIFVNGWHFKYEANQLPENATPAWTPTIGDNDPSFVNEITGGEWHTVVDNYDFVQYQYEQSNPPLHQGFTLEFKGRVLASGGATDTPNIGVRVPVDASSNRVRAYIGIETDRVILAGEGSSSVEYLLDTTSDHTYRLTIQDQALKLYVDGVLRLENTSDAALEEDKIKLNFVIDSFGDGELIETYFDYLYYNTAGAFSPETNVYLTSYVSASDSITITDQSTVLINELFATASDSITLTEDVSITLTSYISTNDSIAITDYADVLRDGARDIAVYDDTILSESVIVTTTDNPQIEASDDITITESVSLFVSIDTNASDSITITENVAVAVNSFIDVNDSITITENVAIYLNSYIYVNDTITLTESISVVLSTLYIDTSDDITLTDNASVLINELSIDASDSITITENVSVQGTSYINTSDDISIDDVLPFYHPESITVTDSPIVELANLVNVSASDSITITESTELFFSKHNLLVSDSITLTESTALQFATYLSAFESVTITESVGVAVFKDINAFESVTITESVSVQTNSFTSVFDPITLTESVNISLANYVSAFDSIALSEAVSAYVATAINTSDSITITESVSVSVKVFVEASESITVTDATEIEKSGAKEIDTSDSITITESVSLSKKQFGPWYTPAPIDWQETDNQDWHTKSNSSWHSDNSTDWKTSNSTDWKNKHDREQ